VAGGVRARAAALAFRVDYAQRCRRGSGRPPTYVPSPECGVLSWSLPRLEVFPGSTRTGGPRWSSWRRSSVRLGWRFVSWTTLSDRRECQRRPVGRRTFALGIVILGTFTWLGFADTPRVVRLEGPWSMRALPPGTHLSRISGLYALHRFGGTQPPSETIWRQGPRVGGSGTSATAKVIAWSSGRFQAGE